MEKDASTIKRELAQPFAPEDLEWRIQIASEDKTSGMAVAYVTNRAIQDRLDDVVGPDNWHNDFKPWHAIGKRESQICGISIYNEERKEWITKWDGAEDTDIEAVKGGLSDSMKRAAVQWGIGRYLYKMEGVWVKVKAKGNSCIILSGERTKLDKAYMEWLKKMKLTPAAPGGTQSELTAGKDLDPQQDENGKSKDKEQTSAQKQQAAKAPEAQPAAPRSPSNVTELPTATKPKCEYTVQSVKVQTGMSRNPATSLTLTGQDGKTIKAFLCGTDDTLVSGAELMNVKLTIQRQDTVVYYVLKSYEVIKKVPKAA